MPANGHSKAASPRAHRAFASFRTELVYLFGKRFCLDLVLLLKIERTAPQAKICHVHRSDVLQATLSRRILRFLE
jgi:hypothetical protein